MLMQVLGFENPRDFFRDGAFHDLFRRIWAYFASISFASQEAFASHLTSADAMTALQQAPLIPITPKQQTMLGEDNARACVLTQAAARGLACIDNASSFSFPKWRKWTPNAYADTLLSAA